MSIEFTDTERAILRFVQYQLPDTLTPYADIAREVGTDEETAYHDACKIEHDLSDETFDNIRAYYNKHRKK